MAVLGQRRNTYVIDRVLEIPFSSLRLRRTGVAQLPPHVYFVVSAVFHYLGPSFAVLLFARVDVLGVAWLRIASAAVIFAALAPAVANVGDAGPERRLLLHRLGRRLRADERVLLPGDRPAAARDRGGDRVLRPCPARRVGMRTSRNLLALALAVGGVYLLTDVRLVGEPLASRSPSPTPPVLALHRARRPRRQAPRAQRHRRARRGNADRLRHRHSDRRWQRGARVRGPGRAAAGIGVGVSSSVIPYVFDQLAMARLARDTYALLVALLPATAVVIGVVVLSQLPSRLDVVGIALVMLGVALQRPEGAAA